MHTLGEVLWRFVPWVVLLATFATAALAQHPAPAAVHVAADSIRAETCRGGTLSASGLTCSKPTASLRVTVVRRLANRLDSLVASLEAPFVTADSLRLLLAASMARGDSLQRVVDSLRAPPGRDSIAVSFDYTTGALWPGEIGAFPGGKMTMPLCASVSINGVWHLGDNAVEVTYVGRPDSLGMTPRPERDGTGLRAMCKPYPAGVPGDPPTFPVRWVMKRITPFRGESPVWLPVPEPVIP